MQSSQSTYPSALPRLLSQSSTTYDTHTSVQYRQQLLHWLGEYMPLGAACCTLVDPDSLLSVGAVVEQQLHSIHNELLHYEYAHPEAADVYTQLVQHQPHVSVLSQHQSQILTEHPRYIQLLQPHGFGDELRAAMMYNGRCWGFLTLYRQDDQPLFCLQEREWIVQLMPAIAAQLRQFCLSSLQKPDEADHHSLNRDRLNRNHLLQADKGILLLSEQLELVSASRTVADWLNRLSQHENNNSSQLLRPLHTAALQLLQPHSEVSSLQSCIPARGYYVWMRAHLVYTSTDKPQVMIELEPAPPELLFQLRCEQFALTVREQQLVQHAMNGLSTRQIAAELYISTFTVQDHLKSIFAKTDTSSRRELLALLRTPSAGSNKPDLNEQE